MGGLFGKHTVEVEPRVWHRVDSATDKAKDKACQVVLMAEERSGKVIKMARDSAAQLFDDLEKRIERMLDKADNRVRDVVKLSGSEFDRAWAAVDATVEKVDNVANKFVKTAFVAGSIFAIAVLPVSHFLCRAAGVVGEAVGTYFAPPSQRAVQPHAMRKSTTDVNKPAAAAKPIGQVMLRPDSCWLVTRSDDRTARIWNADSGTVWRTLMGHSGWVRGVAFSPDGRWLATCSDDTTARIWNADSSDVLHILKGHSRSVRGVAFSPDGRWLATCSDDTTARIWNADSGRVRHTLEGHSGYGRGVAFSPDGRWLVTFSDDTTARIWNADSGIVEHILKGALWLDP